MKEIFIIKVQNHDSDINEVICAYDNEISAEQHIRCYKEIYQNQLKANIWYEKISLRYEFK